MSPVLLGLAAGAALALLSLSLTLGFGWAEAGPLELGFWREPRGWFDLVLAALFGWALGGGAALLRGARRDLEALRPALLENAALPRIEPPRRALLHATAAGLVLGVGINLAPGNWPGGFPGLADPFFVWATLRSCLVASAICAAGVIATWLARGFSRLGPALRVDDLLDLRPLAPLGRAALRNVAVWVGVSVFFAVMLIAPFGRGVLLASMTLSAGVGALAFVLPARGARRRLMQARGAELARVRQALRARLDGKPPADPRWVGLSLADLLAWESRVEAVRSWPFDASTLARFGLYVAIGLGSWVGAALVERALGAALG